jgi:hypothetical protein
MAKMAPTLVNKVKMGVKTSTTTARGKLRSFIGVSKR